MLEAKELITREASGTCCCNFGCLLSYVVHKIVWRIQEITKESSGGLYQDRMVLLNDIWVEMVMKGSAVTPPRGPITHEGHIPGPVKSVHIPCN
jgi:hypothetical protein